MVSICKESLRDSSVLVKKSFHLNALDRTNFCQFSIFIFTDSKPRLEASKIKAMEPILVCEFFFHLISESSFQYRKFHIPMHRSLCLSFILIMVLSFFCDTLEAEDKATFYSPVEIKAPVLVSQNTEERMFVVDSGASMHTLSKKDLSSDGMDTLRRSRTTSTVVTANGEVQTNEEAQVYVHDVDVFVTVQLLDETPAVLSLGKLCSEHGCSYEWKNGETPRLTQNGKTIT